MKIRTNTTLPQGQTIWALNRTSGLLFREDGNLVLVSCKNDKVLWETNTAGNPKARAKFFADGVLAVVGPDGQVLWESGTRNSDSEIIIQSDAQVVMYSNNEPVWSTNTHDPWAQRQADAGHVITAKELTPNLPYYAPNRSAYLVMQLDGNLVLYSHDHKNLWASKTIWPGASCSVQGDGNVVIYNPNGKALWSTKTPHNPQASLVVANGGNLFVRTTANKIIWATGTLQSKLLQMPTCEPEPLELPQDNEREELFPTPTTNEEPAQQTTSAATQCDPGIQALQSIKQETQTTEENSNANLVHTLVEQTQGVSNTLPIVAQNTAEPQTTLIATEPQGPPQSIPDSQVVAKQEPHAVAEPQPHAVAEPRPHVVAKPHAVAVIAEPQVLAALAEPHAVAEPQVHTEPQALAQPHAVAEARAVAEPQPHAVAEPQPHAVAEPQPHAGAEPHAVAEPQARAESAQMEETQSVAPADTNDAGAPEPPHTTEIPQNSATFNNTAELPGAQSFQTSVDSTEHQDLIQLMNFSPAQVRPTLLHTALFGSDAVDVGLFVDVFGSSSTSELRELANAWSKMYTEIPLEATLREKLDTESASVACVLLDQGRAEDDDEDEDEAEDQAKRLAKAAKGFGVNEDTFIEILTESSAVQVQLIKRAYEEQNQESLASVICRKFDGLARELFLALLQPTMAHFCAERFQQIVSDTQPTVDQKAIARVLSMLDKTALKQVEKVFAEKYKASLKAALGSALPENFRMVALARF